VHDLIVIGAGPTGIAALHEAQKRGLDAIAVDAQAPLAGIGRFMEGLPLVSPSFCFEIGGLPLDCRDPAHPTKNELLHYYARVIHSGGLRIEGGKRCTAIDPSDGLVEVALEGTERRLAKEVIFTAWYERKPVPPATSRVRVFDGLPSAADVLGLETVIVGGGVSAVEHAASIMMNGQRITLLVRGAPRFILGRERFQRLVRATGSELVDQVSEVSVREDRIVFQRSGRPFELRCDAVVYCTGMRLSPRSLALLERAGVISRELADALIATPSFEEVIRARPELGEDAAFALSNAERPDLWRYLFEGERGVRFAGGVLHSGAANSELLSSIYSAELAVRAIAGEAPPAGMKPPLATALLAHANRTRRSIYAFEDLAPLRPLAISSWTRNCVSLAPPGHRRSPDDPRELEHLFTGRHTLTNLERDLLERADGSTSVRELAIENELDCPKDQQLLATVLSHLFRSNVLTWLPPKPDGTTSQ
jgi:thioredoxin reductase (NADPH)